MFRQARHRYGLCSKSLQWHYETEGFNFRKSGQASELPGYTPCWKQKQTWGRQPPWPFDLCRNRNVVSCTETPNLCDSELHKHLQRNSKNADTLWNGACCRITLPVVSDSQCAFGKAIAWMRAWVSGCAGVCLLPMFVYYCKSHVVSSIRGPLTPPAHQPLLLALGRPLLSTTWNHERSMSVLVSFRSCLTAVLSHLKSQPRRFSAMTPVTKFISDMLETQMNTSAANLCQLCVR